MAYQAYHTQICEGNVGQCYLAVEANWREVSHTMVAATTQKYNLFFSFEENCRQFI